MVMNRRFQFHMAEEPPFTAPADAEVFDHIKDFLNYHRDPRDLWEILAERPELVRFQEPDRGITILHEVILQGSVSVLKKLLASKKPWSGLIDVNTKIKLMMEDPHRDFPVLYAAIYTLRQDRSNLKTVMEIMRVLVERGADVNAMYQGTVLSECIYRGFPPSFIHFLIKSGADPCAVFKGDDMARGHDITVMHLACSGRFDPDCRYMPFLLRPCNVNRPTSEPGPLALTPLMIAVRDGLAKTVRYLISNGAVIDDRVMWQADWNVAAGMHGASEIKKLLEARVHCQKWFRNKGVNPATRRAIKPNGPTYKALQKVCEPYAKKPQPAELPQRPIACPAIRTSAHVRLHNDISTANTPRKDMHRRCTAALLDDAGLRRVRDLYARYRITEAPVQFHSSHEIISSTVLLSFLIAWHGESFMPHRLMGTRSSPWDPSDYTFGWHFDTLDMAADLRKAISAAQKSKRRYHVIYTSKQIRNVGWHAMLLVAEKTQPAQGRAQARVTVHLIDPQAEIRGYNDFRDRLRDDILSVYVGSKVIKVDYGVEELSPHMFQGVESLPRRSKLERKGHCVLWACLLGEAMVDYETTVGTVYDDDRRKKPIHILRELFRGIPMAPEVWKKLIIDYAFSRALDIYVTLRKFHPGLYADTYVHKEMQRYLKALDVDGYYEAMVVRLPRQTTRAEFESKVSRPVVHLYRSS